MAKKINPSTKLRVKRSAELSRSHHTEYNQSIKKAIIPIAGLGTRFLPLSKILPKEFWPVVDKPVLQYIIEEAIASGIKKIVFIKKPGKNGPSAYLENYFKEDGKLKNILKRRGKENILKEVKYLEEIPKKSHFSFAVQKEPLGASHAVFQAKKLIKKDESVAVLWGDDLVESKIPCLLQLIKIFNKYRKPIIALYKLPKEKIYSYGVVKAKKIEDRVYKIEKIVEKPKPQEAPSNLAIVGKYIITPKVLKYLEGINFKRKEDFGLSEALGEMIEEGEEIYGYEFEGKWLECGNKSAYLETNLYLSLKHPQFGKKLKNFLRKKGFNADVVELADTLVSEAKGVIPRESSNLSVRTIYN